MYIRMYLLCGIGTQTVVKALLTPVDTVCIGVVVLHMHVCVKGGMSTSPVSSDVCRRVVELIVFKCCFCKVH